MITVSLPPTRTVQYTFTPTGKSGTLNIDEYKRRVKIIEDLTSNLPYGIGDIVRPTSDAVFENTGLLKVKNIAKTFAQFMAMNPGKTEVSVNFNKDYPMLVSVTPIDKTKADFVCTVNYVMPYENSGNCSV